LNDQPEETQEQTKPGPGGTPAITQTQWFVGGWLSPLIVAAFTVIWVMLIFFLIGWRTRGWQYGVLPYIPGEALNTVQYVSPHDVPRQVQYPTPGPGGTYAR
jgi:hypothetical protein